MVFVPFRTRFTAVLMAGLLALTTVGPLAAQTASTSQSKPAANSQDDSNTPKPPDPKKVKENQKRWKGEVSNVYKKWLKEDVVYIITPEEEAAFKQTATDQER